MCTTPYAVPVAWVGQAGAGQLHAQPLEGLHQGQRGAPQARLPGRWGERLGLEHYLELVQVTPGARANARALRPARETGQWPPGYDRLCGGLKQRYGDPAGTRPRLPVLLRQRDSAAVAVPQAVTPAVDLGCGDAGALAVRVRQQGGCPAPPAVMGALGALASSGQTGPARLHL